MPFSVSNKRSNVCSSHRFVIHGLLTAFDSQSVSTHDCTGYSWITQCQPATSRNTVFPLPRIPSLGVCMTIPMSLFE